MVRVRVSVRVRVGAGVGVGVGVKVGVKVGAKVGVGARETAPLQHLPRQAESPHCSLMYSLQLQSQLTSASLSPSCVSAALSDAASCVPRACAAGRATVHLAAHTLWLYGSLWLHLLWLHLLGCTCYGPATALLTMALLTMALLTMAPLPTARLVLHHRPEDALPLQLLLQLLQGLATGHRVLELLL